MTTGTAKFYQMNGSLSSGEYPLLAPSPSISSSKLKSTQTVKYAKGLQIQIDVPAFTGYESVNVVDVDGSYYWATAFKERTTAQEQVRYTLDYMGPTTLLRSGQSYSMWLERSPTYLRKYLRCDFSDGPAMLTGTQAIGNTINFPNLARAFYWVQITGLTQVGTETITKRYGAFISVSKTVPVTDIYTYPVYGSDTENYPSLNQIMNYTEDTTGFTADQVLDISISKRCPYKFSCGYNLGNSPQINVLNSSNNIIVPSFQSPGTNAYLYDIDNDLVSSAISISKDATIADSDYNRMCGLVGIKDWNGNIVATNNLCQGLTYSVQTWGDISGLYTIITNGYNKTIINEGKLPWNGSAWYQYKAYSMDADRIQMENNIKYAKYNYETNQQALVGGLVGGSITGGMMGTFATGGNPAGAVAGVAGSVANAAVSAYELERANALQIRQYEDDFRLSQKRAMMQGGTAYNTGYGLIYLALTNADNDLVLGMMTPNVDGSARLTEYANRFGYPCEGLNTVTISAGYYKGTMPATATLNGMYFDELNKVLKNGFRFVTP